MRDTSPTLRQRPSFPSDWSSIDISPSNLTLANTLPIGQSFLWHRHQLNESVPTAGPSSSAQPITPPKSEPIDANELPTEEFSRAILDPPRVVCLRQTSSRIYYTAIHYDVSQDATDAREGRTKRWLMDYFHLERYPDLEGMYADWKARDPSMFGRLDMEYEGLGLGEGGRARGVRLLRQDPWECLIAFITSTNNHIPRIAGLMHRLGTHFSPPLLALSDPSSEISFEAGPSTRSAESEASTTTYHLFPAPHLLLADLEQTLRELGFGYRAGFIESSLATLRAEFGGDSGDIERGLAGWRGGDVDTVREKLIGLKGVGRKVADCVMLMCLDQPHLIPIDTHLSAIASRHPLFPSRLKNKPMSKALYDEVQEFLLDKWGPMGGWAQAVMFALELPETTVRNGAKAGGTPKKTPKKASVKTEMEPPVKIEAEGLVKLEDVRQESWRTPVKDPGMGLDSPLPTPTRSRKGSNTTTPKRSQSQMMSGETDGEGSPLGHKPVVGLPAGYGFKRTRSAARIELRRSESGVSVLAEDVKDLDVGT